MGRDEASRIKQDPELEEKIKKDLEATLAARYAKGLAEAAGATTTSHDILNIENHNLGHLIIPSDKILNSPHMSKNSSNQDMMKRTSNTPVAAKEEVLDSLKDIFGVDEPEDSMALSG